MTLADDARAKINQGIMPNESEAKALAQEMSGIREDESTFHEAFTDAFADIASRFDHLRRQGWNANEQ